tara:strand:- start:251 stop:826 length:576 start_codon:yes stop_codon:yes gene_type:complete
MIKKILGIVVLGLLLSISTKADDIRDFEIEGISIGNSLLDYYNEDEIKKNIMNEYYKNKNNKFKKVEFWDLKMDLYDVLAFHIKTNDNKFIVHSIAGAILYRNNIKDCYKKKNNIINELKELFPTAEEFDSGRQIHSADNTQKSTYDRVDLIFKSGDNVRVICYDWSKETGNVNHLSVGIETKEFSDWLSN